MMSKHVKNINTKIDNLIGARRLSATVTEVCRGAKISCPTFYAHFKSCEAARDLHEDELETELIYLLPERFCGREVIFTILLSFLNRNRHYFLASFQSGNTYLLRKIMLRLKVVLGGATMNEQTYLIYIGAIIAALDYWVERETPIEINLPEYARRLARLPFYRF